MNFNGLTRSGLPRSGLPRPDFQSSATTTANPTEKRQRTKPIAILPLKNTSPTKRLRQQDGNNPYVLDDITAHLGDAFLSPTKKEASQNRKIAELTEQIAKHVPLDAHITHAIADAIIFAFSPKEAAGKYLEAKDPTVPRSIIYDFDARHAYVDTELPLDQTVYPGSRLALQVTVSKNKADATTVRKFQLMPCANRPFEKKALAKVDSLKDVYIPCEAYFIPHKEFAIPTRYALLPLLERRLVAYYGQDHLPQDILKVTYSALRALGKLHAAGLIHGNISINSIHIDADGCAKLTDFSLAKSVKDIQGQLYGTAKHSAPEFFADPIISNQLKPAQDVYAFGRVIREVMTQEELPWDSKIPELQQLLRKYNLMKETANEDTEIDITLLTQMYNKKDAIHSEQAKLDREAVSAGETLATSKKNSLYDDVILTLVCQAAMHSDPSKRPTAQSLADAVFKHVK